MAPWRARTPWGLTDVSAHSGTLSWADSPNADYGNNVDTSLELQINLGTALMPVLEFWHRYSFQEYSDFGYVEVSIDDGANWSRIYFVTGGAASWVRERVDLTEYAGQSNVTIRFRVATNGSGTSDGWGIDDVSINEPAIPVIAYPFFDSLEATENTWLSGSWELDTPEP